MDTQPRLSIDQAEIIAQELLDREPRFRDSWIGRMARKWEMTPYCCESYKHEFNPLVHPGSPRWSAYNSLFDNSRK